ncbi:MAG: sodium:proton antiporter [Eggerthellaceae bacterium]|nr:sodium:proton antiporter [Eggerthellaceae bacterium]
MEALELVLFLLSIVAASSILDRFLPGLSLPIVQIALGAIIAAFFALPASEGIDTELLLILFIAPLHFNESRHADSGALWANRWAIASLAVGLVVAIVICVGATLHALLPMVPLAAAFALGAAMGSTDAVAVTSLSKDYRFSRHHKTLLEGEAFFNDVTGTVIFKCAIGVAATGALSLTHAGEEFAMDLFGGMIGGAIMGAIAWALLEGIKRIGADSPTLHVTLELLLPFVIYLISKQIHIGAVIAVVSAGLVMSIFPHRHTAASARQKLQSRGVWVTLEFILNGIIFVVLGMQLPRLLHPVAESGLADPLGLILVIFIVTLVLEGVRFVWILVMDMIHSKSEGHAVSDCFKAKSLKGTLAMAFAGPKGGITLSLMLTIPFTLAGGEVFQYRETLISIASGVILLTLLLANFGVPLLTVHKHAAKKRTDQVDAEIRMIERTIASIEADAHFTGNVQFEPVDDDRYADAIEGIDEPATIIVMKRYADQLDDLIGAASKDTAKRVRGIIGHINELYDRVDDIAVEVKSFDEEDEDDADDAGHCASNGSGGSSDPAINTSSSDPSRLTAHFRKIRAIYEGVEDVQSQALARQLEIIKQMRASGELDAEQAKELRDEVYIEQLTL